ncbi:MAG TPA: hypothetical protein VFL78_10690 [Rhodanobacteraceae bacterium]|nr:hypothetical protein [Rhodanobacteraceae bacterium]
MNADLHFNAAAELTPVARAIARMPDEMLRALDKDLHRGAIQIADAEKDEAPKFRSELANSIGPERVGLAEYMVRTRGKTYGVYVDEGTDAGGRPPLREMLAWIKLKGIQPRTPGMSLKSLAALLRMRIAQHGIQPNPFAERALAQERPVLERMLVASAERVLARAAGGAA